MADFRLRQADFDFLKGYNLLVTGLWGHTESQLADVRAMGIPVALTGPSARWMRRAGSRCPM